VVFKKAGELEGGKYDIQWYELLKMSNEDLDERLKHPINVLTDRDPDDHLSHDMYADAIEQSNGDLGAAFDILVARQMEGERRAAEEKRKRKNPKLVLWRHNNAINGYFQEHVSRFFKHNIESLARKGALKISLCFGVCGFLLLSGLLYFLGATDIFNVFIFACLAGLVLAVPVFGVSKRFLRKSDVVYDNVQSLLEEVRPKMLFNKLVYHKVLQVLENNPRDKDELQKLLEGYFFSRHEEVERADRLVQEILQTGKNLENLF
jgi:hypothetical protein